MINTIFLEFAAILDKNQKALPYFETFISTINNFNIDSNSPVNIHLVSSFMETKGNFLWSNQTNNVNCIFITQSVKEAEDAKNAGVSVLFQGQNSEYPAFKTWPEALIRLAVMMEPSKTKYLDQAFLVLANKNSIEDTHIVTSQPTKIEATGKHWKQLLNSELDELEGINVQLPVSLTVTIPETGFIKIKMSDLKDAKNEAIGYVRSLKANGSIENINPSSIGSPTHYIETDQAGIRMLKRRGFK